MTQLKIKNIEGLSPDQIKSEIHNGAKFIVYQYCISILVMTFKRSSAIHLVREGEGRRTGLKYTLISLLLGWWGIPWGPIYTVSTIAKNLHGGTDVTAEVSKALKIL